MSDEAPSKESTLASATDIALKRAEELADELAKKEAAGASAESSAEAGSSDESNTMWPMPVFPLVAKFDVQKIELEDNQQALVIAIYTGAGAAFGLVTRDGALALARRIKQIANSTIG